MGVPLSLLSVILLAKHPLRRVEMEKAASSDRDEQKTSGRAFKIYVLYIKGTVSQDFLLQVFFMNHLHPSPRK
jgi:hypothetical protein